MPKESVADKRRREFAQECAIALGLGQTEEVVVPFAEYAAKPVEFVQEVLAVSTVTGEQIKILESVRDRAETNVQAAHGVGKCVAQNDKILLSSGLEVSAKFLVGRDFEVLTLDNGCITSVRAFAEWNKMESVYEITTESGRRIIRNSNHPLWAGIKWSRDGGHPIIDSKGWTTVEQIQAWLTLPPNHETSKFTPKDWKVDQRRKHSVLCAVPNEIPIFGDKELPEHEIKLMAYLIGDGGLTTPTPVFTQKEGKVLEEFRQCVEAMGCVLMPRSKYGYAITNPIGSRHTKQGKLTFGLFEQGDFSCDRHISTSRLKQLIGHGDNTLYGRLRMLGIKPVTFYGKSYISISQFELYKLFDECLKLSALEKIKGSARGNQKRALEILELKVAEAGIDLQSIDISLLEAQKADAIRQMKEQQGIKVGVRRNGVKPNPVTIMLELHGLMGKDSYEKVIPDAIFELPKHQLAKFMSRLFATDGWACISKPHGSRTHGKAEIGFCSVSRSLVEQVQRLLLRFGVVANIFQRNTVNAWCLTIHSSEMLLKFASEIGIFGKEYAIAAVVERAKIAQSDKRVPKWRNQNAPDGTIWEKVESIRKLDNPDLTVAIEVPGYHHYLTNFWEHNSFISACIVLWWVFAVGGLAISTAPTESQVKQILWSEVRKLYDKNKVKLGGERGELFLKFSESARAYGFTARNYDSNSFQGKHAEKLLLIQDEACGITEEIDDGFASCLTGSDNRGLRIGNPIVGGTPFEKSCARQHNRISAWSHVNVAWAYEKHADGIHRLKPDVGSVTVDRVTGDVLPQSAWPGWCQRDVIPGAISIAWIEKVRKKGENSAFWQSRVEGLFPVDSEQSIVPRSWFLQARARYDADPQKWDFMAEHHPWRHGLDVGDGGDDHARSSWRGPVLYAALTQPTKGDRLDVGRAAHLGAKTLDDMPGSMNVDIIGVGSGSLSKLLEDDYPAEGTHWGGSAEDSALFANLKAEQYWMLREGFRNEEIAIAPLGEIEEMLMEDLAGTYYEETTTGKIKIEDKKKTVQRLHRSPNVGDATVLGYNGTGGVVEFESVGKATRVGSRLRDY